MRLPTFASAKSNAVAAPPQIIAPHLRRALAVDAPDLRKPLRKLHHLVPARASARPANPDEVQRTGEVLPNQDEDISPRLIDLGSCACNLPDAAGCADLSHLDITLAERGHNQPMIAAARPSCCGGVPELAMSADISLAADPTT